MTWSLDGVVVGWGTGGGLEKQGTTIWGAGEISWSDSETSWRVCVTGSLAGPNGSYSVKARKTLESGKKKRSLLLAVSFPCLRLMKLTAGTGGKAEMLLGSRCSVTGQGEERWRWSSEAINCTNGISCSGGASKVACLYLGKSSR